ncbi:quinone oxidoreductase family protein [Salinarimonas ramus]|uniref:Quinone oxidoreductase n=1 Tax=Salinarimonas ramus TaxID=690164 RepID=A0A917QGA8_9HYPH|nr:quinone oxidoreductase [Salinarimonas ramus]GGK49161.1 quinone oxidoreductase [Salinarimonas ramus]
MKTDAIRIERQGPPEEMRLLEVETGEPGPGEALVRQSACGVNFLDVYQRGGAYAMPVPMGVGNEAAGIVAALGPDVSGLAVGDRVVYQGGSPGAYAGARIVPAWRLLRLPESVAEDDAAALLLKGMTVEYLLERCAPVEPGGFALMWAAAGGVGLLAGQWAAARGIALIGIAAGEDKCARAREAGYHTVIDRTREDVLARVKEITGGAGVRVAYDSIGAATFETTIETLAPRGVFVSFGATSGPPPAVEASLLQKKGSLYFTRPTLATYCAAPEDYRASGEAVLSRAASGAIRAAIGQRYPLAEAAAAHRDLEAGRTTGATILVP